MRLDGGHAEHERIVEDRPAMDSSRPERGETLRCETADRRAEFVLEGDHELGLERPATTIAAARSRRTKLGAMKARLEP